MNEWISAGITLAAAVVIGAIAARIVRRVITKSSRDAVQSAAAPLSTLVFSTFVIIGLISALGIVNPESLDTIPADLVSFIPGALAAAIVLIGGNVAATLACTAVQRVVRGTTAERSAPMIVRWTILAFAVILAAAQLGVDTTIINIASAALLFGTAAAMALLVGLGGRQVAGEVAAGRAWRSALNVGDRICVADVRGTSIDGIVVEIHPTAVEVEADGRSMLVPNSQLLDVVVERTRSD